MDDDWVLKCIDTTTITLWQYCMLDEVNIHYVIFQFKESLVCMKESIQHVLVMEDNSVAIDKSRHFFQFKMLPQLTETKKQDACIEV